MKPTARRDKMLQTDQNRLKVYTLCNEKMYTYKEMEEATGFTFYQTKLYMNEMSEQGYLEKTKHYNTKTKAFFIKFKATEKQFKPKTIEQVEKIISDMLGCSPEKFGKGKYDELIANNPNLRKVQLFDEKGHDYFLHGQKNKVNRGIGSTWSLYDSASGFDS